MLAVRDNLEVVQYFWNAPALRVPMLLIWVATFGSALHQPCTTYFATALGATPKALGNIGECFGSNIRMLFQLSRNIAQLEILQQVCLLGLES